MCCKGRYTYDQKNEDAILIHINALESKMLTYRWYAELKQLPYYTPHISALQTAPCCRQGVCAYIRINACAFKSSKLYEFRHEYRIPV